MKHPFLRVEPRLWTESKKDCWSFITGTPIDNGTEMLQLLKEKFQEIRRSEQLQVLTVLTKSWSAKEVQQVFDVSEYLAHQSKKAVKESGIPGLSHGPSLPRVTTSLITRWEDIATTFLMMLHHSIKAERIYSICVAIKMILESKLIGYFTCKWGMWWCGWNSQATSCSCQLAKAIQWLANKTTLVVWLGM